ncbi:hypothetical protein HAZT_HAZT003771, partial [Hyalella azteca]
MGSGRRQLPPAPTSATMDEDHCHIPKASFNSSKAAITKLLIASALTATFMVTEVVGGYLSNSIAIMSDAAHMFSDLSSFLVSLIAIYLAMRPASRKMNFGYHRAEVLGALVSVLLIWVITGVLVYAAVERVISMDFEVEADLMIIIAAIGVVMNIIFPWRWCFTQAVVDMATATALAVTVTDTVIPTLAPEYKIADPICTFIFSGLVVITTMPIITDICRVLMEGVPPGVDYNAICSNLAVIPGVRMIHSLHVWTLTTDKNALSVHIAI